jgi:hypothetical protein
VDATAPTAAPPEPFCVPNTREIQTRLVAVLKERDALIALLRVSMKHDKLCNLRAKMEAAGNVE